ncbi:MAG: DUF3102 domain-containing protein [Methylobacterium sp.]|uniref:DUF3102 domain-containing protein n=1 Tax=Methylobacterium sp. TaxID=409 RepID=UPI0025D406D1|nr:DUF3102 domain-containing protein [Methylobacterium sp.]MBX9933681.1 DUF3102 domain-containing protein [Methylobacterium sp.]
MSAHAQTFSVEQFEPITPIAEEESLPEVQNDEAAPEGPDNEDLRRHADRIKLHLDKRGDATIEIGGELLAAKKKIKRGTFAEWLEHHFNWNIRSAQRYMSAATFCEKNPTASKLPASSICMLASPSTPRKVRNAVLEDLENGKQPTLKEIQSLRDEVREQQRSRKKKPVILVPKLVVELSEGQSAAQQAADLILADLSDKSRLRALLKTIDASELLRHLASGVLAGEVIESLP